MRSLRILIADDESIARSRLQRLLGALPDLEIVAVCADGREVLEVLEHTTVDALLLDISMPHLSGTEVAGLLGPDGPLVVFLTAHAEHAVTAFHHGAADYILKPIAADRLALAIDRVRARLPESPQEDGRLTLQTARGLAFVRVADIQWCGIEGESVVIHATRTHHTDLRLIELERRLPTNFRRVHRQALVNLDHIVRLESTSTGGYLAHLANGHEVEVSRAAARRLRKDRTP